MREIYLLGFGCGGKGDITLRTLDILQKSDAVFVRTMKHPSSEILNEYHISFKSFDDIYESYDSFDAVYEHIADEVTGSTGECISYIVPGSAVFAEKSVQLILKNAQCPVHIIPAVSFLDGIFASLKTDALSSYKLIDALDLENQKPDVRCINIICQIYDRMTAADVKLQLMRYYSDDTPVILITAAATDKEKIDHIPLFELDRIEHIDHLSTLIIPPADFRKTPSDFSSLTEIIKNLRSENGCPWDRAQTHESLTRYLIEETYEVIDAIEKKEDEHLCEELGDLLLQVMLHAQIASENDSFDISDVIRGISEKMIRRHPHVFESNELMEDLNTLWEKVKSAEKNYGTTHEKIQSIPRCFPSPIYAHKVQSTAAKAGFDFENAFEAFKKLPEEFNELKQAMNENDMEKIKDEGGDLLFAIINVLRFYKISSEEALKKACDKFIGRFEKMERSILKDNKCLADMTEKELDEYWKSAKK